MLWILRRTSLEVFLITFAPLWIASIIEEEYFWMRVSVSILAGLIFFSWYLIIGLKLNEQLPDESFKPDLFFKLNWFYVLALFSTSVIIGDPENANKEMPIYIMVLVVYFVFAFFYLVYFTANAYVKVFASDKTLPREELILFAFMAIPLGVWIVQPRIRKMFIGKELI